MGTAKSSAADLLRNTVGVSVVVDDWNGKLRAQAFPKAIQSVECEENGVRSYFPDYLPYQATEETERWPHFSEAAAADGRVQPRSSWQCCKDITRSVLRVFVKPTKYGVDYIARRIG